MVESKVPRSKVKAKAKKKSSAPSFMSARPASRVDPAFKRQHLSILGEPQLTNREIRLGSTLQVFWEWARTHPLPATSIEGVYLAIHDLDIKYTRHCHAADIAFSTLRRDCKYVAAPVLVSFKPRDVHQWEQFVYDYFYNYCIRPLQYNSLVDNGMIAWLCKGGGVPDELAHKVEALCYEHGGLLYSHFLEIIEDFVDSQPGEIRRKETIKSFLSSHEPPKLSAITTEAYKDFEKKIDEHARLLDIQPFWDEEYARWLRPGFAEFPELDALIARRAFHLAIRYDEKRIPSCKAMQMRLDDLMPILKGYIKSCERKHLDNQADTESQRSESEDDEHEETLEEYLEEVLKEEREICSEKIELEQQKDVGKGTSEDERRLRHLAQRDFRCQGILRAIRHYRKEIEKELGPLKPTQKKPARQDSTPCEPTPQRPAAQETILQDAKPQKTVSRKVTAQDVVLPNAREAEAVRPMTEDDQRLQRCRMVEIRRRKLGQRTLRTR